MEGEAASSERERAALPTVGGAAHQRQARVERDADVGDESTAARAAAGPLFPRGLASVRFERSIECVHECA